MKIYLDNVDFNSTTGPNQFGKKLAIAFEKLGHSVVRKAADVQLSFIKINKKIAPVVLRLDGIYFDENMDWKKRNEKILESYKHANAVIFQSEFDKELIFNFFGSHRYSFVIHNGTDLDDIEKINACILKKYSNIWSCSSDWGNRGNKRLNENIEYFLKKSGENDCLFVLGEVPLKIPHDNIVYPGRVSWEECISVYKVSKYFIHLAFVDHCPNVVVDAKACGCKIVCSASGGTKEIAGENAVVIDDYSWNMKTPINYKQPPSLDFENIKGGGKNKKLDINFVASKYIDVFEEIVK